MPLVLTADELAERWSVPKTHIYRLTREGDLPTLRLGRYYRYPISMVEAIEAQAEAASNDVVSVDELVKRFERWLGLVYPGTQWNLTYKKRRTRA